MEARYKVNISRARIGIVEKGTEEKKDLLVKELQMGNRSFYITTRFGADIAIREISFNTLQELKDWLYESPAKDIVIKRELDGGKYEYKLDSQHMDIYTVEKYEPDFEDYFTYEKAENFKGVNPNIVKSWEK